MARPRAEVMVAMVVLVVVEEATVVTEELVATVVAEVAVISATVVTVAFMVAVAVVVIKAKVAKVVVLVVMVVRVARQLPCWVREVATEHLFRTGRLKPWSYTGQEYAPLTLLALIRQVQPTCMPMVGLPVAASVVLAVRLA